MNLKSYLNLSIMTNIDGSDPGVVGPLPKYLIFLCRAFLREIKTFKASLYSSQKHFIFNNVLLMNRRLALKVFIIDKETSGKWIIKNKALVP